MAARKKQKQTISSGKRKILDVINEEMRAAGLPGFDELERLKRELGPKAGVHIGMLTGLLNPVNKMSEPDPQEIQNILVEIKGKLRYAFRPALSQAAEQIKKQLPRKPSGGRRASLSAEQKIDACNEVAALIRRKVSYKNALVRVGQRFKVSARTVQRAWQQRGNDV